METQPTGTYEPGTRPPRDGDRVIGDTPVVETRPTVVARPAVETGENVMPVRDRVQWGPIFAGLFAAAATMLLMSVLGIALGASVLDPENTGTEIGTWAALWGAASAIVAFFVGGWLAAKTAAVGGSFAGLVNGLMVGATGLTLILWLTGSGLGNLFGTIGADIGGITNLTQDTAQPAADDAAAAVDEGAADLDSESTFDTVRDSAFITFLGLLLPLIAAALGGYLGRHERRDLIEGTG